MVGSVGRQNLLLAYDEFMRVQFVSFIDATDICTVEHGIGAPKE